VADYRPKNPGAQKIKRKENEVQLELVANPDIAATMGTLKKPNQINVGFALETNNGLENAKEKLKKKNLNLIVLNQLGDSGAGFNKDTNKITLVSQSSQKTFETKSKTLVAQDIWNELIK
jgi:phosphopantothenoylcysteine decarboxylase/phosphopantothenate--cysteine ligase